MSLRDQLRGTGVAIVTPFRKGKVDYDALGKLTEHLIRNKVEHIVTLGSTGETPTLSKEEKKEISTFTLKKVNKRVPVVIGIGGNNTHNILDSLTHDDLSGFTAILSSSPNYNKPSQEGIYEHYKAIAKNSPLPVIVYNVPGRTGSNITAATTLRLANDFEKIAGIKEASGNMVQCMHIIQNKPKDFLVVSGDDHITLPLVACGFDGVISVIANCFPKDFSEMVRQALKHDFKKAQAAHYKLLDAIDLLFIENNPAGVKCFLAEMGFIQNELRLPLVPLSKNYHARIKTFLKNYKG